MLPNVPTVAEAGYPEAQYLFWCVAVFPGEYPRAIVDRLHAKARSDFSPTPTFGSDADARRRPTPDDASRSSGNSTLRLPRLS